jgi:hypothetical protein
MTWRNLMVHNLGWKLLSLFLGALVWHSVNRGIEGGFSPFSRPNLVTIERPVSILTSRQMPTAFEVRPAKVNVTVQGRRDVLQRLSPEDIVAYVDLSDVFSATEVRRPVEVSLRRSAAVISVDPASVQVLLARDDGEESPPRIELKLTP